MRVSLPPILIALQILSGACDLSGPPLNVDLVVAVDRDIVAPGEWMTITIMVQNPGEDPVSLGLACAPLGFRVRDGTGRRVSPPSGWEESFACIDGIDNLVTAGGSKNYVFVWTPFADYRTSRPTPLPPGQYEIFAGFAGEPLRPPFSDPVVITVRTSGGP